MQPGESRRLAFQLEKRAFSYYDVELGDWYVPEGEYRIQLAASSRDIRCEAAVRVRPLHPKRQEITGWSTIGQLRQTQAGRERFREIRRILLNCGKEHMLELPIFDESEAAAQRVDSLPLRMITLLSDNVLNNDIMDRLIERCNQQSL